MKDKVAKTIALIFETEYLRKDLQAILREAASFVAKDYEEEDKIAKIIVNKLKDL